MFFFILMIHDWNETRRSTARNFHPMEICLLKANLASVCIIIKMAISTVIFLSGISISIIMVSVVYNVGESGIRVAISRRDVGNRMIIHSIWSPF